MPERTPSRRAARAGTAGRSIRFAGEASLLRVCCPFPRHTPSLDVRRERLGDGPARFERSQDHVERHRRPPEDLVTERIADRVQDGARAGADRRFADAARADRRFGIGQIHGAHCIFCQRRGSSAACCGGIAWPARRNAGRDHFWPIAWPMPSIEPRESGRPLRGESPCRRQQPPDSRDVDSGLDVDLTSANPATKERDWPSCVKLSFPTPIRPWPASRGGVLVDLLMSFGSSWPS